MGLGVPMAINLSSLMEAISPAYDVAIIGGGLAGLALSIQLVRQGYSVIVFEKEHYPFHKVCGEYISMEAWPFLESLGVPLKEMQLPVINNLLLSAPDGTSFQTPLPLGGFGISRFLLDSTLASIAQREGVYLLEETKVEDVKETTKGYNVQFFNKTNGTQSLVVRLCAGAYGKRSNLDIKWKRAFVTNKERKLNNYIAVKYHINGYVQPGQIALHNFSDGYCGVSSIERDTSCVCYLTTAANLKRAGYQIDRLEREVLHQNPELKKLLEGAKRKEDFPITIAQISFVKKTWGENGVLMIGDAAGMITPLCGNGMSMALHSSKIMAALIPQYLKGALSYQQLLNSYRKAWTYQFGRRMQMGRWLQRFFGKTRTTNLFLKSLRLFPFLAKPLIRKTHGSPF